MIVAETSSEKSCTRQRETASEGDLTQQVTRDCRPQENAEHPRERENDSEAKTFDESLEIEACSDEREEGQEYEGSSHLWMCRER